MAEALTGVDISKIMSEEGSLVKCVLLQCHPDDEDGKPSAIEELTDMSIKEIKTELASYGITETFVEKEEMLRALEKERARKNTTCADNSKTTETEAAQVTQDEDHVPLSHLIQEITIDTTPRKSQVAQVLGGDFTFLGQYESEGIMVMIRRPDWEREGYSGDVPKVNPHRLHPPFHDVKVRGDILLMRVAETKEELDDDDENGEEDKNENGKEDDEEKNASPEKDEKEEEETQQQQPSIRVPTNEEFFLDYTKSEYLKFAARTDVVWEPPEIPDESDDEEDDEKAHNLHSFLNGDEDSDDNDEAYDPESEPIDNEEDYEEEHQIGMLNLILGQCLRKFHEEHNRGPNTYELLDMRKALADRLGVEVPEVDEVACDWDRVVESPKKHDRRVVVDEERNKCETIEDGGGEGVLEDDGDIVEGDLKQDGGGVENGVNGKSEQESEVTTDEGEESGDLKRPAQDMENDNACEVNGQAAKRAKLDDETEDS